MASILPLSMQTGISIAPLVVFPCTLTYIGTRPQSRVRVQSLGCTVREHGASNSVRGTDELHINGGPAENEENKVVSVGENGRVKSRSEKNWVKDAVSKELELLWDDGYKTKTVKDYLVEAREIIKPDGGPPRWFCPVECSQPLKNSPILLFLPGLDGTGLGLTLHHKALGKVFAVQCLHIPVYDRTPFEGLVKFVEETVRNQHASSPKKPIYMVGDSLGGCLALAVAARNPEIDLVVILCNPGTSFTRSHMRSVISFLEALPEGLSNIVPILLSFIVGNPLTMAIADADVRLPPKMQIEQVSANLISFFSHLSDFSNILPKENLIWKLKLLNSAASYANSRLHAVKAEVLVLTGYLIGDCWGKDNLLPGGKDEAEYLKKSLQNCSVRHFEENGHALLMEGRYSLLSIIKGAGKYRRSRKQDILSDFVPPSLSEYKYCFDELTGWRRLALNLTTFSTMDDGRIVRGLAGVPDEGPVLLVGNHLLLGMETTATVEAFLKEKNLLIHGAAHPMLFDGRIGSYGIINEMDWFQIFGAVPVTASNFCKLFSLKSHVLLYPGGGREAFHYKGEEYKVIWPEEPEFVRVAAKYGATIVPFASVGEDDIAHMVLDYNDLIKIPMLNDFIRDFSSKSIKIRGESKQEVSDGELFVPLILPKIPTGRYYTLYGKPIKTKGKEKLLLQKSHAKEMYLQVKSTVETNIDYLLTKRKEDPYRGIVERTLYRALYSPLSHIPAFDP